MLSYISKQDINYYILAWGVIRKLGEDEGEQFHEWLDNWIALNSDLMGYPVKVAKQTRLGKIPHLVGGFEKWKRELQNTIYSDYPDDYTPLKILLLRWDPSRYTAHAIVGQESIQDQDSLFDEAIFLKNLIALAHESHRQSTRKFIQEDIIGRMELDRSVFALRKTKSTLLQQFEIDQWKILSSYLETRLKSEEIQYFRKNGIKRFRRNWEESAFKGNHLIEVFYTFSECSINIEFKKIFVKGTPYDGDYRSISYKILREIFNFGKYVAAVLKKD
ncbi:MAG: hypothetical protein ACE5OZ_18875 [Candidatus Heimdallarchaeota archaeon]